ncbi:hypothetical protein [Nocardia sp. CA-290969]|uniref:hypothetical protein n=1 Tax=Nocardia sp. CA-290969 TaxID=3239986 RepID=UPI003D9374DB
MAPEQASPHWDRIVGDDWPQIPPAAWHGLETAAREGAAALNLADIEQARRAFEETVQRSAGLAQIRTALVALENNPRAFAAALTAAADTFGTFGEVIRRTRNQILDVVDDAGDRIEQATHGDSNDDGEEDDEAEAEADRQATEAILAEARGAVADIVAAALNSLGPQGLPRLDDIAEALGQPGPWRSGSMPGVAPRSPGAGHPAGEKHHWEPGSGFEPGRWWPGAGNLVPADSRFGQILVDLLDDLLHPGLVPESPPVAQLPPPVDVQVPAGTGAEPAVVPAAPVADPGIDGGAGDPAAGAAVPPGQRPPGAAPTGDTAAPTGEPDPEAATVTGPADADDRPAAATEPAPEQRTTSTPESAEPPAGEAARTGPPNTDESGRALAVAMSSMVLPTVVGAAPAATTAPTPSAPGTAASSTSGGASAGGAAAGSAAISSTQAGRGAAAPVDAQRAPGATGKVLAHGAVPAVAAAAGRGPGSLPTGEPGAEKRPGAGELVEGAVGAAMIAAAAPSFVVGERVDADLALARTLLGGIRAAVDSWVVGVDWAVAVLRHPGGVSAFVTSNEGRGWLPARLYLPSELSLPWLWAVAEESGWEGIADPARILVEFALAWGAKSGAKLSALASSQPIDLLLGQRLGNVGLAGSVGPSDAMDLRRPAAGMLDRLGLTAAPRLLDRAASVPDRNIAVRCLELAVDAHIRVDRETSETVDAMGAPEIRLRILRAVRDGREFAASWWQELQDADDLIAATALGHRADTSRIALGELRPGAADSQSGSDSSVLRSLTFQRRCNELVLLLAEEQSRQTLRDAVYAHAQILAHPFFTRPPETGPAPRRTAITTAPDR